MEVARVGIAGLTAAAVLAQRGWSARVQAAPHFPLASSASPGAPDRAGVTE